MNIEDKIRQIDKMIDEITAKSDAEYERCLKIYNKNEHIEEYKILLFNGVIQHFSILTLNEIKNAFLSQIMARKADEKDYSGLWFSSDYFHRNTLFQLNSALNKIATLLKYRFTASDGRYAADMNRILKQVNKNPDYLKHPVRKLINDVRGLREYQVLNKNRDEVTHGLEPAYLNFPEGNPKKYDWIRILNKLLPIVNEIYLNHHLANVNIRDEDINNYKIVELDPPQLDGIGEVDFFNIYEMLRQQMKRCINTILNYNDCVIPWIKGMVPNEELNVVIKLIIAILSDVTFRAHDAFRSFSLFMTMTASHYEGLPEKIKDTLTIIPEDYFLNMTCFRAYSVFDKVGLFLTRVFSMPKDKTYFKDVTDWILNNSGKEYQELKKYLLGILESNEYKALDLVRQQYVHGMNMAFHQLEGCNLSLNYMIVLLILNLQIIFELIGFLQNEFIPNEIERILPGSIEKINILTANDNPYLMDMIRN